MKLERFNTQFQGNITTSVCRDWKTSKNPDNGKPDTPDNNQKCQSYDLDFRFSRTSGLQVKQQLPPGISSALRQIIL